MSVSTARVTTAQSVSTIATLARSTKKARENNMNEENKEVESKDKKSLIPMMLNGVIIVMLAALIVGMILIASENRKDREELQSNIDAVKITIDDLNKSLGDKTDAINQELDKMLENDKTHTEQIDGINTVVEQLKKTFENDKKELNKRIDEIEQAKAEKKAREAEMLATSYTAPTPSYSTSTESTGSGLTPTSGINNFNGHTESWYNLPMDGVIQQARNFGIEGEYWVNPENGVKMYGDYVICACNRDLYPIGSLVETSFGTGISLDTGTFVDWNPTNCDIAVDW